MRFDLIELLRQLKTSYLLFQRKSYEANGSHRESYGAIGDHRKPYGVIGSNKDP